MIRPNAPNSGAEAGPPEANDAIRPLRVYSTSYDLMRADGDGRIFLLYSELASEIDRDRMGPGQKRENPVPRHVDSNVIVAVQPR
jgi:hypothetical protein